MRAITTQPLHPNTDASGGTKTHLLVMPKKALSFSALSADVVVPESTFIAYKAAMPKFVQAESCAFFLRPRGGDRSRESTAQFEGFRSPPWDSGETLKLPGLYSSAEGGSSASCSLEASEISDQAVERNAASPSSPAFASPWACN